MKIAISGKGGTGKTTVAGILARSLARSGHDVVAVDADPNPNLGIALGLGVEETAQLEAIANRVMREAQAHGHDHGDGHAHEHKGPDQLVEEMAVVAPDGVRLVQTGTIERPAEGCMCCGSHATTRIVFNDLDATGRTIIADLEAGINDLIWAYPKPGDILLVVTEPYRKSIEVARRALSVAEELQLDQVVVVANRCESDDDADRVAAELGGAEVVAVPDDVAVWRADRDGRSPLDAAPDSPAVAAVQRLAARLGELQTAAR
ncbi:MAG: P-loop NTPase [Actinomycetota bacterium]